MNTPGLVSHRTDLDVPANIRHAQDEDVFLHRADLHFPTIAMIVLMAFISLRS
jgi:hypothetical protein